MLMQNEHSNIIANDLLWTLFIVALNSYRHDSVLRPFPRKYLDSISKEKDIDRLRAVASCVPSLETVDEQLNIPPESLDLLNWVISTSSFKLEPKTKEEFFNIQRLTKQILPATKPNYVFEVIHSERRECKFQHIKNGYSSIFAYHGSRLENFYSILHNGLVAHLNKNALFGSGTYFSSELSISLPYSSSCYGWDKSILGPQLSCVAVCEIVDHPSVKCHGNDKNNEHRSHPSDSLAGKLPEKYYIVQNNDFVIVRYLLIYTFNLSKSCRNSWWKKHKFAVLMFSYTVILLVVGLLNSSRLWIILKNSFS